MSPPVQDAFVALGANLGDRAAALRSAAEAICGDAVACVARSAIYETSPVGGPTDQPEYLNAVLHLRTTLPPRALLDRCLQIEARLGRVRGARNAPRVIDLDLLLYGDLQLAESDLQVPHPRLHLRRFVLAPLVELTGERTHPALGARLRDLLAALPATGENVRRTSLAW